LADDASGDAFLRPEAVFYAELCAYKSSGGLFTRLALLYVRMDNTHGRLRFYGEQLPEFIYSVDLGELMIWAVDKYEGAPCALMLSVSEEKSPSAR